MKGHYDGKKFVPHSNGDHVKFHNLRDNKEEYVHVSKTKVQRLKNKKMCTTAISERNGAGLAKIHG
jgi:hypothetical protein